MKTLLDGDTWQEEYGLVINPHDPEGSAWQDEDGQGAMFETYGEDHEVVCSVNLVLPNHLWTYIDYGNGTAIVSGNGYHTGTPIGYFITKKAWEEDIMIMVSEGN